MSYSGANGQTDMDLSAIPGWFPGAAIAVGGTALQWWRHRTATAKAAGVAEAAQAAINSRTDEKLSELKSDLTAAMREFQSATLLIAKLSSSQEVINGVTARTLESINAKQEEHARQLAHHATALDRLIERIEG